MPFAGSPVSDRTPGSETPVPRRAERCDADVLVVGGEIRIKGDSTVNRDNSRQAPMSNRCIEPFVAGLSGDVIVVARAHAAPDIETGRPLEHRDVVAGRIGRRLAIDVSVSQRV